MPKLFHTKIACLLVALITQAAAWAQSTSSVDATDELKSAERIGLKTEFIDATKSSLSSPEMVSHSAEVLKVAHEARLLRHLWLAQFQIDRILAQIDEEHTVVSAAIDKIENRKALLANMTDSANFLSTSIIALIGNTLFIAAPPPRPTVPNELFSVANGVSMIMSTISLLELQGGKARLKVPAKSMLLPLLVDHFEPPYSDMVWTYLNSKPTGKESLTPRQELLYGWKISEDDKLSGYQSRQVVVDSLGLADNSKKITLQNLRARQLMLEQLEICVAKMSRLLADLVRRI
jgi:hypothetical protein